MDETTSLVAIGPTRQNRRMASVDGWLRSPANSVGVSNAEIVEPPPGDRVGAILFIRAGTLMALPFDMKRLEAAGEPIPVAKELGWA